MSKNHWDDAKDSPATSSVARYIEAVKPDIPIYMFNPIYRSYSPKLGLGTKSQNLYMTIYI